MVLMRTCRRRVTQEEKRTGRENGSSQPRQDLVDEHGSGYILPWDYPVGFFYGHMLTSQS